MGLGARLAVGFGAEAEGRIDAVVGVGCSRGIAARTSAWGTTPRPTGKVEVEQ